VEGAKGTGVLEAFVESLATTASLATTGASLATDGANVAAPDGMTPIRWRLEGSAGGLSSP
jgi:hypothetical protein